MAEHILKTWPTYWNPIEAGLKRFEVRKNDRAFQTGDTVILRRTIADGRSEVEYQPLQVCKFYDLHFKIGWILQGGQFGIEPGYCVFQLEEAK